MEADRGPDDSSDVEADADHPGADQKFPWDRKPEESGDAIQSLTHDENSRLLSAVGKLTSWLAGQSCQSVPVPEDVRSLISKLKGSKALFVDGKGPKLLQRLRDLDAVSEDFRKDFLAQSPQSQHDRMHDFFHYLFRRGMRGVLNFVKVLYEHQQQLDVIQIVEHIAARNYIPPENIKVKAEKAGYIPESSPYGTGIEVKKGHYQGGSRIYPMSSAPRGFLLIINNEYFENGTFYVQRRGTAVDGDSLASLFTQMGFHLYDGHQFRDQTKQEMEAVLDRFARDERHASVHASVVCILSHGRGQGDIAGVDGGHISDRQIENMFTASRCPHLANKPKLFFFVACRGNDIDYGLTMVQTPSGLVAKPPTTPPFQNTNKPLTPLAPLAPLKPLVPLKPLAPLKPLLPLHPSNLVVADALGGGSSGGSGGDVTAVGGGGDVTKVADHADFFSVYATVPGHQSLRHVNEGSFFVQEFVKVVAAEAYLNDLFLMVTEVNNRLSTLDLGLTRGEMQTLEIHSRLRRCVFFNPGFSKA